MQTEAGIHDDVFSHFQLFLSFFALLVCLLPLRRIQKLILALGCYESFGLGGGGAVRQFKIGSKTNIWSTYVLPDTDAHTSILTYLMVGIV